VAKQDTKEPRLSSTIVVVEPDDAVRASICDLVELLQLDGRCFASAAEFQRQHAGPIDALIVELALPGEDAMMLIQTTRRSHPGVQVLALSTMGSQSVVTAALEAGADDVFEKPHLGAPLARKLVHLFRARKDHPGT
jgi:DNA-binding response OmpR family regulator